MQERPNTPRFGVRGRLMLAFLAICVFSLVGAASGFFSLLQVGRSLNQITEERVPLALAWLELSRQAERVVRAAPALLVVTTEEARVRVSAEIATQDQQLKELLVHIGSVASRDEGRTGASVQPLVGQLNANIASLEDLVRNRLSIVAKKIKLISQLNQTRITAQRMLASGQRILESQISEWNSDVEAADTNQLSAERSVAARSIVSLLPQQNAAVLIDAVHNALLKISEVEEPSEIDVLLFPLKKSLAALSDVAQGLPANFRKRFVKQVDLIENLATGALSLAQIRKHELEIIAKAEDLLAANAQLSAKLTTEVSRLVAEANTEIVNARSQASAVQALNRNVLLAVVVLSLVSSILIVWLYVGRNLIARLTALSDSMLAIAGGDLRALLPAPGSSDEIGRMAEALVVFRDTAVEVEKSNLREIESARRRLVDAIESSSEGFAFYGPSDKLVICNTRYRELLYPGTSATIEPGMAFETIVRAAAENGLVVDAQGRIDDWVAERLAMHRDPGKPRIQRRRDGRWILISERKTEDGGTVAIYSDITDLKLREEELTEKSGALEKLFGETQRLLKVTEDRASELDAIGKVSQALIAESELDSTIQLIGNQMREIFNADIVYVALLDPETKLIHFPYQVGETFTTLKLGEGLASKIIETGEPLLINQDVLARTAEIGAVAVGKEAQSYLGVPIKTARGTIGVISVQSTTQEGLFTDDSLRLLTTIAANAGAALHNAQLFSNALEHLRQVEILTNAASAIESRSFEPGMIDGVAARTDALGELARVFRNMAQEVRVREQRLRRQLQDLQLDIDEKQQANAETIAVYIPMDRRQAMAHGRSLPEATRGTALFADITGFTPLTEQLASELGLQRGAEEIIRHLNRVFTVLIDEVHHYGGSVIGFCGDAITCWFDECDLFGTKRQGSSTDSAVASALAMQKGMGAFAAIATPSGKTIGLAIKVAVATGPARRFVVGESAGHEIDVVAGGTLNLLAEAEHQAQRGEIVLAATGLPDIEGRFKVSGWREGRSFAVVSGLTTEVAPAPWPEMTADAVAEVKARPWLLPAVFEKVQVGKSGLLSELRAVTALFMNFSGIAFDTDKAASAKFDRFIQWVERVIAPHNGSIIQVTVGDKGSYLYAAFGAPVAHLDDTLHAVQAALELAAPPAKLKYINSLRIGLAAGQMRVGAYGGAAHRTYGALGDKTNLAARLMMAAEATDHHAAILCDASVFDATQARIEFEALPPVMVKGKTEPIIVYRPIRRFGADEVGVADPSVTSGKQTLQIDRLPPAEQLTIKVASVIGQSFSVETLSAVYPEPHDDDTLLAHLKMLSGQGFIVAPAPGSSSFAFKDTVTHDTAYALMLYAQRRQLHRAMAELLEQAAECDPPYAEIANHWKASDEIPKAVSYFEKAGQQARAKGKFDDASRFFKTSLELNS